MVDAFSSFLNAFILSLVKVRRKLDRERLSHVKQVVIIVLGI